MTFPDFERLTYLTDFFGLPYYNLEIWNRFAEQFKSQFDALIALYNEVDIEKAGGIGFRVYAEEVQGQDMWVRDFCRHAPSQVLCEWLESQAMKIYQEQGIEPFWQADAP